MLLTENILPDLQKETWLLGLDMVYHQTDGLRF